MSKDNGLSIGAALAHAETQMKTKHNLNGSLAANDLEYVHFIQARMNYILTNRKAETILKSLPILCCQGDQPYLSENVDLFIVHFLLNPKIHFKSVPCKKISKHLNNCYRCFEIFSQTLSDYHRKISELSKFY